MFIRPQIMRSADTDGSGGAPAPAADPAPVADNTPAADPAADPTPSADPAPAGEPAPEPTSGKQPWERTRIDQLTREKHEARREVERLKALLEATPKEGDGKPGKGYVPETEVDRRAAALLEQRQFTAKVEAWDKAGCDEFGEKPFRERCNVIAHMGLSPNEKPEFMSTIIDMDDGHKIIAHLADHPDEATELVRLPTHKMAMKLAALSGKLSAPKRVSGAPAPVSTPVGAVQPSRDVHDPNLSQEAYAKLRREQRASRRKW